MASKKQITTIRLFFRVLITCLLCYGFYVLSCIFFALFLYYFLPYVFPSIPHLSDIFYNLPIHHFFNINGRGSYLFTNNMIASILSTICFGIILFVIHRLTQKVRTKKSLITLMVVLLFSFPTIHKSEYYPTFVRGEPISFQQAVRAGTYGLAISPFGASLFYFFTRPVPNFFFYYPKFEIELFGNRSHYIGEIKPTPFLIVELVSLMSSIIAMVFIWRHFINKNKRLNKQKHQENG